MIGRGGLSPTRHTLSQREFDWRITQAYQVGLIANENFVQNIRANVRSIEIFSANNNCEHTANDPLVLDLLKTLVRWCALPQEIGSSDRDATGLFVRYNDKRCSKNYRGNNWLVAPKRPKKCCFLILRCRFFLSLRCKIRQELGCSPANRERQLGSDRRETD